MPAAGKHLDGDLLKHMGVDYQRYTQQHASKVTRRQEGLNAAIPRLEQQAVQLQQQLAGEAKGAAVAAANFGAAEGVRQELEALAARLGRLQQSLGEVERLVQQRVAGGGT
jgi:prefoldin subunit 5